MVKQTQMDDKLIQAICKEYRYTSAEVVLRCDATVDDLIDVLEGNRIYIPCLYVLNKIDSISIEELDILVRIPHVVPISSKNGWNIDYLLETIWKELKLLRLYAKPKGQLPDFEEPVILPRDKNTVNDFCIKIHRALADNFKHAWVWGTSVKFNPQKVGKDHKLDDEDVVQIVKNN